MLIGVVQAVNSSTGTLEEFRTIRFRATSLRYICPLLHRSPLANLIGPLLQSRELGEINLQGAGTAADPRVVGNIGNCVL